MSNGAEAQSSASRAECTMFRTEEAPAFIPQHKNRLPYSPKAAYSLRKDDKQEGKETLDFSFYRVNSQTEYNFHQKHPKSLCTATSFFQEEKTPPRYFIDIKMSMCMKMPITLPRAPPNIASTSPFPTVNRRNSSSEFGRQLICYKTSVRQRSPSHEAEHLRWPPKPSGCTALITWAPSPSSSLSNTPSENTGSAPSYKLYYSHKDRGLWGFLASGAIPQGWMAPFSLPNGTVPRETGSAPLVFETKQRQQGQN